MKVAIATNFHSGLDGYSLVHCVEQQLLGAQACGVRPLVIVREGFQYAEDADSPWSRENRDLRPAMPHHAQDETDLERDISRIHFALDAALAGCDAVLTHDLFFLRYHTKISLALRRIAARRPQLTWLNWAHSSPQPSPPDDASPAERQARFAPPPGRLVCLNESQRYAFAQQYQVPLDRVVALRHGLHPLSDASPLARKLFDRAGLHEADVAVFFASAHYRSKGHADIVRMCSALARLGLRVRWLWCDWACDAPEHRQYQRELRELAKRLGWDGLRIASELDRRCRKGTPRGDVLALMRACDLVVHPSTAEACSVLAHEALLAGCLLVVHRGVPHQVELWGPHAVAIDFARLGADEGAWAGAAMQVAQHLRHNPVLRARSLARTAWSHVAAWRAIEPLLTAAAPMADAAALRRAESGGCCGGSAPPTGDPAPPGGEPDDDLAGRRAWVRQVVCETSGAGGGPCEHLRVIGPTQWCGPPLVGGWRRWLRRARGGCGCNLNLKRRRAGARCPLGRW